MLSEYPHFADLSLPDQLRLTALEAEARLPLPMLDAIQRAADPLQEEIGWEMQPAACAGRLTCHLGRACQQPTRVRSCSAREELLSKNSYPTTATGNFDLAMTAWRAGCTVALSPKTLTIVKDPLMSSSILGIMDNGVTPVSYEFDGWQVANLTVTLSCPGEADVVEVFPLPVVFAVGKGPFTAGQTRIAGTSDDGQIQSTWDFKRP